MKKERAGIENYQKKPLEGQSYERFLEDAQQNNVSTFGG